MSFSDDSTLYDERDPRAATPNRMSLARGAGHMTIWNRRLLGSVRSRRRPSAWACPEAVDELRLQRGRHGPPEPQSIAE